jgi:hypothetical protein
LALLLTVTVGVEVRAQPAVPPPPRPGGGQMRKEVRERLRMMRMWRLTEALNLDEATAQRLFPLLNRFDERLAPLQREQVEIAGRIQAELDTGHPDPARLSHSIDEIVGIRQKVAATEEERIRELRKVLNPVQQARFVLAWPRIEQELRRQVRRAMNLPVEE